LSLATSSKYLIELPFTDYHFIAGAQTHFTLKNRLPFHFKDELGFFVSNAHMPAYTKREGKIFYGNPAKQHNDQSLPGCF
jgi:hypothetical protein